MERPRDNDVVEDGRDGPVLRVRVRPRSARRGVLGITAGELTVGVGAPPERGKATAEAVRAVAAWLGVPPSRVRLISGGTSRSKRLLVAGESSAELRSRVATRLTGEPVERGGRRPDNGP